MPARVLFRSILPISGFIVSLGLARAPADAVTSTAPTGSASYDVKGMVENVDTDGLKVVIVHEAIRGYMDAMTMEFRVKDGKELRGLQSGNRISFRLFVTGNQAWIERVQKLSAPAESATLDAPGAPVSSIARFASKMAPELKPGEALPQVALQNQFGKPVRLNELRGQALVLTFIFTRCPYPEFCPLMNNNLKQVQDGLLSASAGNKWQLFSISIDPRHDTAARLNEYARHYRPDPARWFFLTGDSAEIKKLTSSFGLTVFGEAPSIQHNLRTVVVDARGNVQRIFIGNEWKPADLIAEMQIAMKVDH
jgi:protein SCO1/2